VKEPESLRGRSNDFWSEGCDQAELRLERERAGSRGIVEGTASDFFSFGASRVRAWRGGRCRIFEQDGLRAFLSFFLLFSHTANVRSGPGARSTVSAGRMQAML
jgi:hypothetical protein